MSENVDSSVSDGVRQSSKDDEESQSRSAGRDEVQPDSQATGGGKEAESNLTTRLDTQTSSSEGKSSQTCKSSSPTEHDDKEVPESLHQAEQDEATGSDSDHGTPEPQALDDWSQPGTAGKPEVDDDEFDESRIETPPQLRVYRRMPGFQRRVPALQKWKRVAHSIILWLRLYHFHSSQVREILRFFSDADLLTDAIEDSNFEELLFSVHSFRPNKQARVNLNTLNIMSMNPSQRSQRDVRPIEAGLRGYEAFRKYPPSILRRIAEKAWFQEFDKHSVIVREGDRPLYYYFIIYGSALVSIIDRDKMIARAAALLNRGDSFGELAIIDGVKRASTVIAREKCGLMMLEDKDYLEIFMQGGVTFLDDSFVRNHVLFNGFDRSVLKANPRLVKLNYFSPGVTIVEDSRLSFWIFLVISGKATVKMAVHKSVLEQQEEEVIDTDERERQQLLADYRSGSIGHRTLIRRNWRQHLLRQDRLSRRPEFQVNLELRQIGLARQGGFTRELSVVGREATMRMETTASSEKGRVVLPPLTKAYLVAPSEQSPPEAQQQQQPEAHAAESQSADKINQKKRGQKITYISGKEAVMGRRTLATDLNREFYEQVEMKLLLGEFEQESLFEYLPVQILERGMLFGFADHFFENQPALKVVSKGCELLCIRRELYFENANEITLFGVGNSLRPYPSELAVLGKNKEVRAWTQVKARQYSKTVTDMARESVDVHDALTRFPAIKTPR